MSTDCEQRAGVSSPPIHEDTQSPKGEVPSETEPKTGDPVDPAVEQDPQEQTEDQSRVDLLEEREDPIAQADLLERQELEPPEEFEDPSLSDGGDDVADDDLTPRLISGGEELDKASSLAVEMDCSDDEMSYSGGWDRHMKSKEERAQRKKELQDFQFFFDSQTYTINKSMQEMETWVHQRPGVLTMKYRLIRWFYIILFYNKKHETKHLVKITEKTGNPPASDQVICKADIRVFTRRLSDKRCSRLCKREKRCLCVLLPFLMNCVTEDQFILPFEFYTLGSSILSKCTLNKDLFPINESGKTHSCNLKANARAKRDMGLLNPTRNWDLPVTEYNPHLVGPPFYGIDPYSHARTNQALPKWMPMVNAMHHSYAHGLPGGPYPTQQPQPWGSYAPQFLEGPPHNSMYSPMPAQGMPSPGEPIAPSDIPTYASMAEKSVEPTRDSLSPRGFTEESPKEKKSKKQTEAEQRLANFRRFQECCLFWNPPSAFNVPPPPNSWPNYPFLTPGGVVSQPVYNPYSGNSQPFGFVDSASALSQ